MKYAIQKDGRGARVIESEEEVGDNEVFSKTLPAQQAAPSGGFAVRTDGKGWRAVNSPEDVGADEVFSDTQPAPIVPNPIIEQITAIEAQITPRRMREATLTAAGKTWLAGKDAEIAALRAAL